MHELTDLNPDVMKAELDYRRTRLTPTQRRPRVSARHWWQRVALAPREHS
ncbi:MAG TPA: hypothetical protein VGH01_06435 [Jatrophihabitantaceae bacterium]|jgi:hypothetical protein